MYTSVERVENRVIKYVIGVAGTAAALGLGFMRLEKSAAKSNVQSSPPPTSPAGTLPESVGGVFAQQQVLKCGEGMTTNKKRDAVIVEV